jgi:class 3 adenylate cyclase
MKFIECLASYVPGLIVDQLIRDCDNHNTPTVPWRQEYETVCVFCDVSGFTALSEAMALNGKGAEGLAKHLNSYFSQMVRIIAADGGDVFKFAGDAMIVLWPESQSGDMETTVRRAAQCAVAIQENLDKSIMEEGVQLSVKIGIGFGRVSVLHVGGVYGRVEYLAVGEPLIQAFHAEHNAVSGQVICSKEVWKIISEYFPFASTCDDGSVRIDLDLKNHIKLVRKTSKMNTLRNNMSDTDPNLEGRMKAYVAGAVLPKLNRDSPEDEQWGNELRRCTVMFVNLGMKEQHLLASAMYDEALTQVHEVLRTVQKSVYQYEGSINKFLMDDKGSTLIACFGLPPVSHDDDPTRAILASLLLCEGLYDLGLIASVGITTGDVFCGVVGSKTRREYTVLGDSVNLSARLMQKACADGGGILCDWDTKCTSNGTLHFANLGEIRVKGKSLPVKIFRPYPPGLTPITSGVKGPNVYRMIHRQQLQNAIVHKSLLGFQSLFTTAQNMHQTTERYRSTSESTSGVPSTSYQSPPLEILSGRRQSAIMEQMRISGPATRTRRSVVRSSIATSSTCAITKALEALSIQQTSPAASPSESSIGASPEQPHRRASATSYKLNTSGPASPRNPLNRMDSGALPSVTLDKPIEIHVLLPAGLLAEYTSVDQLPVIYSSQVRTLNDLKERILTLARDKTTFLSSVEGFSNISPQDVSLNIPGTRFFLPEGPYPIRWLSVLFLESKSEFPDGWKFGDSIDLLVCLKSEVRKVQSRLALAHRTLVENKISLIESKKGSVVYIEGEMGVGKTDLIAKFIKNTIPNSVPIYYVPASPYSLEPFGPFNLFLQQYLDSHALLESTSRTLVLYDLLLRGGDELLYDGILLDLYLGTNLGEYLLKQSKGKSCSNEVPVGEPVRSKEFHDALSPSEKASRCLVLYFYLLIMIGCEESMILILDDLHCIDDDSWALILLLTFAIHGVSTSMIDEILGSPPLPTFFTTLGRLPSIFLIVLCRPLIKHRSIFRNACPIHDTFLRIPQLTILKLDGLPPEESEQFLLSRLGGNVRFISDQLVQILNQKCMGNPWLMGQLIDALRSARPPLLTSNVQQNSLSAAALDMLTQDEEDGVRGSHKHSSMVPSLGSAPISMKNSIRKLFKNSSDLTPATPVEIQIDLIENFDIEMCPLPPAIAQTCGTLLDRLNSCQQMILKTAAYIGKQFTWSYLYNCYPLAGHKYRLRKELQGLLTQGYIIEIPSTQDTQTFHFVSEFLLNLISARMLIEQKEKIKNLVEKYQSEIEAKQRRIFAKKALPFANSSAPLKLGYLKIQKKVTNSLFKINIKRKIQGGDWKTRYCVVSPSTPSSPANISLYRDDSHFHTSPHTPTQTIFLQNAFTQIEPEYVQHDEKYVFRVDVTQYLKDRMSLEENRSFLFAGSSSQDITDWVYMIKYTIELVTDLHRASIRKSNNMDNMNNSSLLLSNPLEKKSDVTLEILVHGVRDVVYPEVYNSSQCYVNPVIDEDNLLKTHLSFDVTNNHEFNEIFQFSLSKRQWLRSNLNLLIKSMDLFLTDDILGSLTLPLKSFPLNDNISSGSLSSGDNSHETNNATSVPFELTSASAGKWYSLHHKNTSSQYGEILLSFKFSLSSELEEMLEVNEHSYEKLKASVELILSEEDAMAQGPGSMMKYPTRITDMKSIRLMFQLADEIAKNITPAAQRHRLFSAGGAAGGGDSGAGAKDKKASSAVVMTGICTKKLSEQIHHLLRRINDDGHDVHPTTTSGSVNKMWVCSQFREILKEFEKPSDSLSSSQDLAETELHNPFKHIMEQASTLDQQHLDWLASQYTRESSAGDFGGATPDTLSSRSRDSSFTSINASREESIQKKARRSSILRLEKQASISKRLSLTLSGLNSSAAFVEPLLFDTSTDIDQDYYCLDKEGNKQGPFPAKTLYSWLLNDLIHLQIQVSHGFEGNGDFYPLGMFERTFRRIVNNSISEWPVANSNNNSGNGDGSKAERASSSCSLPITMGVFADPNHIIHHYYRWDFDLWDLELHELLPLSMILTSSLGLSDGFLIHTSCWRNFMDEVQEHMTRHRNPYHNYYHVLDVTQTCFVFISEMGGFELLRSYEILALIVSALTHDLDHPGLNNLYQVNARTSLALDYNDISVLENYHCSLAFTITNQSNCQIFQSLDSPTAKVVRKLIISLILATDMTSHFSLKTEIDDLIGKKFALSSLASGSSSSSSALSANANVNAHPIEGLSSPVLVLDDKEREVILKAVLHTADISNPAKFWRLSKKWSDLVVEEFFNQGDREKAEGLPVSPNMDRLTTFQDELSVNFTDFIVAPYFFALSNIFPKLGEVAIEHLASNRETWHGMILKRLQDSSSQTEGQGEDKTISATAAAATAETISKWEKRKTVFENSFTSAKENSIKLLQII